MLLLLPAALAYECAMFPTDGCSADGVVVVSSTALGATATVTAGPTYARMDVFARVCSPTGLVLHLADSPSNDADVGDAGDSDHDAELYLDGRNLTFAGPGNALTFTTAIKPVITEALDPAWLDAGGCAVVRLGFADGADRRAYTTVSFDPDPDDTSGDVPVWTMETLHGPRLDYTRCGAGEDGGRGWACEWEDADLSDMTRWYVGVNRTVGDATRSGRGVRSACVVLSEDRATIPGSCL